MDIEKIISLETNIDEGLHDQEVNERLSKYGYNKLQTSKKKTLLSRILDQLMNVLIYVLIGAAVISMLLGEWADAFIITLVVIINAVVGIIQESKAEEALEALKNMSVPKAVVRRNGIQQEIPSEEVVPGDIVILDAGRYVPCDVKLLVTVNLQIEEAALTGESVPVEKDSAFESDDQTTIADQKNRAFMSTFVTNGRGIGIAVRTGMDTEIGKVAKMLGKTEDVDTPLQVKLAQVGKKLGLAAVGICVLLFGIGVIQGREFVEMFMLAVSLAVAAIPEGMPAIVSIVLAIGVQRMIRQHVIIRKLPAVEALGSVNVICSDKTGTLTQNKMTVTTVYVDQQIVELSAVDSQSVSVKWLFETMVLCNDATYSENGETGDPTEVALVAAGYKLGFKKEALDEKLPRVAEIPFDSKRKRMTTVHQKENRIIAYTKGAIDRLLPQCTHLQTIEGILPLTDDIRLQIEAATSQMSSQALRVLGYAYRSLPNTELDSMAMADTALIFVGLTGMIDPPREEVREAITVTKDAGIRTVMITGDHQETAFAIAKELGIATSQAEVMEGQAIEQLTDEQLLEKSQHTNVYARVSPEHKVKIVQALQATGQTVSMTGDGVNDAPSLKAADVGVAMGITGTDVAKGAADMVLTDDNFASIVKAVEEGRTIYRNIKKAVLFLLSCNLGEIIVLFTAILFGWPAPLRPIHILWINLVTDTFPALALGVDPEESDVMKEPPRHKDEGLFKGKMTFLLMNGLLIGLLALIAFGIGISYTNGVEASMLSMMNGKITEEALVVGQTMAFLTLSFAQLVHSFNFRSMEHSVFRSGLFANKWLNYSVLLGIALQVTLVSVGPLATLFSVTSLTFLQWGIVVGLSVIPLVMNELWKWLRRK